jgi:hypothetical protein
MTPKGPTGAELFALMRNGSLPLLKIIHSRFGFPRAKFVDRELPVIPPCRACYHPTNAQNVVAR